MLGYKNISPYFFLVHLCFCFWLISASKLLVCPGLYHFSGPDYAVSSSCLYVRSEAEAQPGLGEAGTEWLSIDICPQATWVTGREGVRITGGQVLFWEELGAVDEKRGVYSAPAL